MKNPIVTNERPAWIGAPDVESLCDSIHAATEKRALRFEKRMRYERWLETEDGDANGGTFCSRCVVSVQKQRIKKKDPYIVIGGWDESPAVDNRNFCEK